MKIHVSHPGFDIEEEIIKAGNVPSPIELAPWQKRIDQIAGKTLEGRSRLRIVWGQSRTMFVLGRQRMAYPFWRTEENGEIYDIGTPRFYVEELHDMAELRKNDNWERARYQWDGLESMDVLGPIPEDGFYTSVFLIAHHDEFCCGGRGEVRGNLCLGAYRPPTDADLTRIRRMKQRRDDASNAESAPSLEQIQQASRDISEKRDERFRERIRTAMTDWIAAHGHRITDSTNPKIVAHGKYKFMPTTKFAGSKEKAHDSSDSSSGNTAAA